MRSGELSCQFQHNNTPMTDRNVPARATLAESSTGYNSLSLDDRSRCRLTDHMRQIGPEPHRSHGRKERRSRVTIGTINPRSSSRDTARTDPHLATTYSPEPPSTPIRPVQSAYAIIFHDHSVGGNWTLKREGCIVNVNGDGETSSPA
jgi:hypothetical protein